MYNQLHCVVFQVLVFKNGICKSSKLAKMFAYTNDWRIPKPRFKKAQNDSASSAAVSAP